MRHPFKDFSIVKIPKGLCLGSDLTPANLLKCKKLRDNFDLGNNLQNHQSCKSKKWWM